MGVDGVGWRGAAFAVELSADEEADPGEEADAGTAGLPDVGLAGV
jgi:hypothetical protein